MTKEPDETDFAGVAVYDGTRLLGEIRARGDLAEAILADGVVLGQFDNRRAATDAILMVARSRASP